MSEDMRLCRCADPENCTERVPGYRCKRDAPAESRRPAPLTQEIQRIIDRSSHCIVQDATGAWHPAVKAKVADLKALSESSPGMVSGPLKLDNDRQIFFYEQDHYYLSNFASFNLLWKERTFPTSEHAYHWEKFVLGTRDSDGAYVRDVIRCAPSAHEAFKLAERWKALRRPDWDAVKVEIMRDILRAKAAQHEYVRRKLLQTGTRELVENSWRDDYWGWGPNRDGKNMLGRLWMEVRAELSASERSEG